MLGKDASLGRGTRRDVFHAEAGRIAILHSGHAHGDETRQMCHVETGRMSAWAAETETDACSSSREDGRLLMRRAADCFCRVNVDV